MDTQLDFVALHTLDLNAAHTFYTSVLGFKVQSERPGATVFGHASGAILAIREPRAGEPTQHLGTGVSVWFGVSDADAYASEVKRAGARIVQSPQEGPFGRMFSVLTPDGHIPFIS